MGFNIKFSQAKNELLKATREVSFEEVIECLRKEDILDNKVRKSKLHTRQRIYIVKLNNYAYIVPYVINEDKKEIFLKTIYPSRKYTKLYLKGE